jgi:hypoxanthine-guanine phosphoribosyltransferase
MKFVCLDYLKTARNFLVDEGVIRQPKLELPSCSQTEKANNQYAFRLLWGDVVFSTNIIQEMNSWMHMTFLMQASSQNV